MRNRSASDIPASQNVSLNEQPSASTKRTYIALLLYVLPYFSLYWLPWSVVKLDLLAIVIPVAYLFFGIPYHVYINKTGCQEFCAQFMSLFWAVICFAGFFGYTYWSLLDRYIYYTASFTFVCCVIFIYFTPKKYIGGFAYAFVTILVVVLLPVTPWHFQNYDFYQPFHKRFCCYFSFFVYQILFFLGGWEFSRSLFARCFNMDIVKIFSGNFDGVVLK